MRIAVTADLHYNIARSRLPTLRLAEEVCGLRADALLILGDVGGHDPAIVSECLRLFEGFSGQRFFVAGNHELWTGPDGDALDRLERELPDAVRRAGFHPLDVEPAVIGGVGLAGSVGWYDYSFRDRRLEIPLRFYRDKIAPGAAARTPGFEHLLAETADVPLQAMEIGTRWMDGAHVRLPMSDEAFCRRLCDRLDRHLAQLAGQCDTIVVGLHHVPFAELVPPQERPGWAFASAFLGSAALGEILLRHPKVRHVFCGHTHAPGRAVRGHIVCTSVACTYLAKRYELLDL